MLRASSGRTTLGSIGRTSSWLRLLRRNVGIGGRLAPVSDRSSLDAELVAFRVVHAYPVLAALLDGSALICGAHLLQPRDLRIHSGAPLVEWHGWSAADVEVEVHPVLRHLRLRDALEEEARAVAVRILDGACIVPLILRDTLGARPILPAGVRRWGIGTDVVQRLLPERRHATGIGAVEDNLHLCRHGSPPAALLVGSHPRTDS